MEEVGVGGVVREFFEWAFVWGDVDPHFKKNAEKLIVLNFTNSVKIDT